MNLNLEPKKADTTVYEGEGGGYYLWSNSKNPVLGDSKLGAAKLVLKPHGFAIPHYADSAKIGYVLQGTCTVGMVSPKSPKEQVLVINKGDAVPVPLGVVSWWFNSGDTDMAIIFLGETTKVYTPGQFTYFFLTGTQGILGALSSNFISRAFDLNHKESEKLTNSRHGAFIIKLGNEITFPEESKDVAGELYVSIDNAVPEVDVKGGGIHIALTETNFPLLGGIGLSATLKKLEANAVFGPIYGTDETVVITYVIKGSGKIEIVGAAGKSVLNSKVKAGEVFVLPRFLAGAAIAGADGLEIFSVKTSSKPLFGTLGGNKSVWKALSPVVLQVALNVDPKFEQHFKSYIEESSIIVPPKCN